MLPILGVFWHVWATEVNSGRVSSFKTSGSVMCRPSLVMVFTDNPVFNSQRKAFRISRAICAVHLLRCIKLLPCESTRKVRTYVVSK